MTYRSDIDGLRAVAVLLVLLFHLDPTLFTGGFVGVDVFFVISGYLMTRLIADESRAGSFSFAGFYARRCRRILPALLVMLSCTVGAGYVMLAPDEYRSLGNAAIAAALSCANLYFYRNSGYFFDALGLMPLLHTWSLGVEEQFYLIWPVLLMAAYSLSRRGRGGMAMAVVACTIIGFAVSMWAVSANQKAAFYLLHARLWELAAGGLIVFWRWPAQLRQIPSLLGLILIAAPAFTLTRPSPFPGINALAPVIGAMLIIAASPSSLANQLLALAPLRFVGKISYSLYLWHWPIIAFWMKYNNAQPDLIEGLVIIVASLAAASLSWKFIEQPFRRKSVRPVRDVVFAVSAALVVALGGYGIAANQGFPDRMPASLARLSNQTAMWFSFRCPYSATAIGNNCAVGAPWDTASARGLLWGDSHASHLLPYLDVAGRQTNRAIAILNGCTPPLGGRVKSVSDMQMQRPEVCAVDRAVGMDLLKRFPEIEFVIFASRWPGFLDMLQTDNDPEPRSIAHGLDLIRQEMQATINEIRSMGRQILLVDGIPVFDFDPVPCASSKGTPLWRNAKRVCANPVASLPLLSAANQIALSRVYHELASENDGVFSISLSKAVCASGSCLTYLDGEFLFRDPHHLRRDLSPELTAKLSGLLGLDQALARLGGNAPDQTDVPPGKLTRLPGP
jgi:peptidoglycan/LPS O-acetylase OafA/YrhL